MSQRAGGVSRPPWDSLNLSPGVGDDAAAVATNRARFAAATGVQPVWLQLVHGADVVRLSSAMAAQPPAVADAAWTTEAGLACTVGVADCLPVLLAWRRGAAVAAAHAGWRGLALGVLEATVKAMCDGAGARPADLLAWLGPCIGLRQFEVGADVLAAFGQAPETADPSRFRFRPRADGSPRWLANLALLATDRLAAAGVTAVSAAGLCTVEDRSRFFSFRRDGVTGRMAASVWLR
jgi:polyphenol oxidase